MNLTHLIVTHFWTETNSTLIFNQNVESRAWMTLYCLGWNYVVSTQNAHKHLSFQSSI